MRLRLALPLIFAAALQGCVAAVIPLAAGAAITTARASSERDAETDADADAEVSLTTPPAPTNTANASSPAQSDPAASALLPETQEALRRFDLGAGIEVVTSGSLTTRALPPSVPGAAEQATFAAFAAFADYALGVAALDPLKGEVRQSALLARPGVLVPDRAPCNFVGNSVLIDLDPAAGAFDPARPIQHSALADALAKLRAAEIEIVWGTSLTADRAGDVRNWLKRSGLDLAGKDRLLLLRYPEDRKQTRREDASSERCLIAMLGDERADFDELFDYLKNPDAAVGLDAMLGEGWFLAPVSQPQSEATTDTATPKEGPEE
ncbi:hypothetical protein LY632_01365 [Erythrobacter sp. SDW2]|uniref:hypothetical protein n=1 Tax=Erythrobacter sp. SDW2 TaxID=2907154 RepID=UPI001F1EF254|nr:hypothetical protein [Erythrobacter sp. SDW2]UIP07078.1 hypothetical protein LY632_01365 [Erythrobacter sp. SDW2]